MRTKILAYTHFTINENDINHNLEQTLADLRTQEHPKFSTTAKKWGVVQFTFTQ
jgi:hypothetical protein